MDYPSADHSKVKIEEKYWPCLSYTINSLSGWCADDKLQDDNNHYHRITHHTHTKSINLIKRLQKTAREGIVISVMFNSEAVSYHSNI